MSVQSAAGQAACGDRHVMVALGIAGDAFDVDAPSTSHRAAPARERGARQGRHRRPERTICGVVSETLGERRRLVSALIGLAVITACLVILIRSDPALWVQAIGVVGRAMAERGAVS